MNQRQTGAFSVRIPGLGQDIPCVTDDVETGEYSTDTYRKSFGVPYWACILIFSISTGDASTLLIAPAIDPSQSHVVQRIKEGVQSEAVISKDYGRKK